MKDCGYRDCLIDYIEVPLNETRRQEIEEHLQKCPACATEIVRLRRLYGLLNDDPVVVPEPGFWRQVQDRVRQEEVMLPAQSPRSSFAWWKLAPVLVPVLVAVVVLVFLPRPPRTISIPVSLENVIHGSNLDSLMLDRMIDDQLVESLNQIEPDFEAKLDEVITELNHAEKEALIKKIIDQYGGKI
jgi:hypothetical protein